MCSGFIQANYSALLTMIWALPGAVIMLLINFVLYLNDEWQMSL